MNSDCEDQLTKIICDEIDENVARILGIPVERLEEFYTILIRHLNDE